MPMGSQDWIVITSDTIAQELFNKRGTIYSTRPHSEVIDEMAKGTRVIIAKYGEKLRQFRRIMNNYLSIKKIEEYNDVMNNQLLKMLLGIAEQDGNKDDFWWLIKRYAINVVLFIAFSLEIERYDDPLIQDIVNEGLVFNQMLVPFNRMSDFIPLYKTFFGSGSAMKAASTHWIEQRRVYGGLFERLQKNMANGTAKECFGTQMIKERAKENLTDVEISQLSASLISAGNETTSATLLWTVALLIRHPHVLKNAQEEVDKVVGRDALPDWSNEPDMPYIRALVKEVHRFRPVTPLGVPHATTTEDVYEGYTIPAGSTVILNVWGISQDPKRYKDPKEFNPDRFLGYKLSASEYANAADATQRDHFDYGGGRRICAGIHLAEKSLFKAIACLVWCFDLSSKRQVELEKWHGGNIVSPVPFEVTFKVRDENVIKVIREAIATASAIS